MSDAIEGLVDRDYAFGFHSDIDTELAPKGLTEDVVRLISAKKGEPDWLLEWRLGAYRHFLTLTEPTWAHVTATRVPSGETVVLSTGGQVTVNQHAGTGITVRTQLGALFRIDAADALDLDLPEPVTARAVGPHEATTGPFDLQQVYDALDAVYDPEIPVSIVQLGLVYRCDEIITADGTRRIEIDMTMTAPGCGMGDILRADAELAAVAIRGVDTVDVTLVWDPPWTIHHMPEETRLQLGLL